MSPLHGQRQRLLRLLDFLPPDADVELLGHWGKYCCIVAAGYLENALVDLFTRFATGCSSPAVGRYAAGTLRRLQNPKTKRFVDTARLFDPNWGELLANFCNEDGRREAIDSIMQNRHLIAHGNHSPISVGQVKKYLARAIEVIDFIEADLLQLS